MFEIDIGFLPISDLHPKLVFQPSFSLLCMTLYYLLKFRLLVHTLPSLHCNLFPVIYSCHFNVHSTCFVQSSVVYYGPASC